VGHCHEDLHGNFPVANDPATWRRAAKFSSDGAILAIGEADERIRLVAVATASEISVITTSTINAIMALECSPESRVFGAGASYNDQSLGCSEGNMDLNTGRT